MLSSPDQAQCRIPQSNHTAHVMVDTGFTKFGFRPGLDVVEIFRVCLYNDFGEARSTATLPLSQQNDNTGMNKSSLKTFSNWVLSCGNAKV